MIDINWLSYFFIFILQLILLLANISPRKNKGFYLKATLANTIFYSSFVVVNWNKEGGHSWFNWLSISIASAILLSWIIILSSQFFLDKSDSRKELKIIPKRKMDLDLLQHYVTHFQMVGLNGKWGTGKTYLVNQLKTRIEDEYEFIEISVLVSNLNEFQLTLVNSFEELLYSRRVIPNYANRIMKDLESRSFLDKFKEIFGFIFASSESNAEIFSSFKEEVAKLDKKVLIIYEDLDRIEDKKVIKEIFAVSEKLASEKIKVLYQYDEETLVSLGITNEYLEKYIPFKMNMTELNLLEMIQFELQSKEIYEGVLFKEDFDYLTQLDSRLEIKKILGVYYKGREYLSTRIVSFRTIENMLSEILLALSSKRELEEYKETVISFFIVKHLFPEHYIKLQAQRDILDTFTFQLNGEMYSLPELLKHKKVSIQAGNVKQFVSEGDNRATLEILRLLDVEIDIYNGEVKKGVSKIEKDKKVNRIIRKLFYEGTSIFTDYEYAVNKLREKVFAEPENRVEKFNQYIDWMNRYDEKLEDNESVLRRNDNPLDPFNPFDSLYKIFRVVEVNKQDWLDLNDVYFACRDTNEMDIGLFGNLRYVPLEHDEIYFQVLEYINNLKVKRNFEEDWEFQKFFQNCTENFGRHGIDDRGISSLNFPVLADMHNTSKFLKTLNEIKENMNQDALYYKNSGYDFISKRLTIIKRFIEQLCAILESGDKSIEAYILPSGEHPEGLGRFTTIEEKAEYERLEILVESKEENVEEEIEKGFEKYKITLASVKALIDKLIEKRKEA